MPGPSTTVVVMRMKRFSVSNEKRFERVQAVDAVAVPEDAGREIGGDVLGRVEDGGVRLRVVRVIHVEERVRNESQDGAREFVAGGGNRHVHERARVHAERDDVVTDMRASPRIAAVPPRMPSVAPTVAPVQSVSSPQLMA